MNYRVYVSRLLFLLALALSACGPAELDMDQATSAVDIFLDNELGESWNNCTRFSQFEKTNEVTGTVNISVQLCALEGNVSAQFNRFEDGWYLTRILVQSGSGLALRQALARFSDVKKKIEMIVPST